MGETSGIFSSEYLKATTNANLSYTMRIQLYENTFSTWLMSWLKGNKTKKSLGPTDTQLIEYTVLLTPSVSECGSVTSFVKLQNRGEKEKEN